MEISEQALAGQNKRIEELLADRAGLALAARQALRRLAAREFESASRVLEQALERHGTPTAEQLDNLAAALEEADDRRFPVLDPSFWRRAVGDAELVARCPTSVPWALVAPGAARAALNHGQTLERLAERGGLAPDEMWCVVHDKPWRCPERPSVAGAVRWLIEVTR